jgi:hypothetical protein
MYTIPTKATPRISHGTLNTMHKNAVTTSSDAITLGGALNRYKGSLLPVADWHASTRADRQEMAVRGDRANADGAADASGRAKCLGEVVG